MKLILQFLKPHWKLTVLTVLLAVIDVGGSLFIPTPAAHLLNQGTSGVAFEELLTTSLQMGAVSLFSSICAILGGYACATLAARIGKDMRVALYEKSLKLSIYDFRQFGTASITTRTVSDITTIQFALTSFIQMVLPVPLVCIIALALSFQLNATLGTILLILTALVFILALGIMRSASPLFKKLQKLLDRMTTILLENITGVRVVRAFNNEEREQNRMSDAFSNYAETSIMGNLSSQVQQQIGKDFRGGVPVEAFARTMIQLFCKFGQSLCRKRNLIGVFGNVLPQQAVDLLVRPSFPRRHGMRKINLQGRKRLCNLIVF